MLSVLGPQSSGKSTLLNFLFGCQYSTSVSRCTRGVYGSMLKIKHPNIDYILILDTEGLCDPSKVENTDFDRKISLFCFAVSKIILINMKGELSSSMKNLLQICACSLHSLNKTKECDNLIFTIFNQNSNYQGKRDQAKLL